MKKKTVLIIVAGVMALTIVLLTVICWHHAYNKVEDIPEMEESNHEYGCYPIRPDGIVDFCYDTLSDGYYFIYQDDEYTIGDTSFVPCADENGWMNVYCSEAELFDLLELYSQLDKNSDEFNMPIDGCCYIVFVYADGCHGLLRWKETSK